MSTSPVRHQVSYRISNHTPARHWQLAGADNGDIVVDIGSNDGTLLKAFQTLGARGWGSIPPARLRKLRLKPVFRHSVRSFHWISRNQFATRFGQAKIITANNVCAHIDDLQSVVAAVSVLLADDGVFAFEVSYLLDVLSKTLFDTIYHEHLDYHAISPLIPFFKQHGLTVFNAERVASHGGSIRVFAAPGKKRA